MSDLLRMIQIFFFLVDKKKMLPHWFISLKEFEEILFSNWESLSVSRINDINYRVRNVCKHVPVG